jgi:ubiquinol-cytochrome c reductase cytochrome c1 subunit
MRTDWRLPTALRLFAVALLIAADGGAWAADEGGALPPARNDILNVASLQRGARNFVNYCSGCHSLQYVRFNRIGTDLRIPPEALRANLMFNPNAKVADTLHSAMPAADATNWFGTAPPDLSLMARARSPDYIYGYLKGFYLDPSRPTGVNNVVLKGTAMPDVLVNLRGEQKAVFRTVTLRTDEGKDYQEQQFDKFEAGAPGTLNAQQFDDFVRDTVNFLQYAGEPVQAKREELGVWVVLFLLLFTLFAYLLYKDYWREVD